MEPTRERSPKELKHAISNKIRSKTDFMKKPIERAREILSSIHQPRNGPKGRVHSPARVDFNVSFAEVDFVINPILINLCRELTTNFQFSSHNLIGQPSHNLLGQPNMLSDISRIRLQDVSITTTSNVTLQMSNRNSPMLIGEEPKVNDEIQRTRTFILFPTDSDATNPQATGVLSGNAFFIIESDHSSRLVNEKLGDNQETISFPILQSNTVFQRDTDDRLDQNVAVKLVKINSENTGVNEKEDLNGPQKQMKPFQILTFDSPPKSKTQMISSRFCVSSDKRLDKSTTNGEFLSKVEKISPQYMKRKAHVSITRFGPTRYPETSSIGRDNCEETSRFEVITVDPMFSSITMCDKTGSLQIIQRPVRGLSRNFQSPEKKLDLYNIQTRPTRIEEVRKKRQTQFISEKQKEPIKAKIKKRFGKFGTHQKSQFQGDSCIQEVPKKLTGTFRENNSPESSHEFKNDDKKIDNNVNQYNIKEQDDGSKKTNINVQEYDKEQVYKEGSNEIKQNIKVEHDDTKEKEIRYTTYINKENDRNFKEISNFEETPLNNIMTFEDYLKVTGKQKELCHPEFSHTNKSDDISSTVSLFKKKSKLQAIHKYVETPRNNRRGNTSTDICHISPSVTASSQSTQSGLPSLSVKLSQKMYTYYSQIKNRADELKRRTIKKLNKSKTAREISSSKTILQNQNSNTNEIKKKEPTSANRTNKDFGEKMVTYNEKMEITQPYIVIFMMGNNNKSFAHLKSTDKIKLDRMKKPVKTRGERNIRSKRRTKPISRKLSKQKLSECTESGKSN